MVDRFIAKVERVPYGCIEWRASCDSDGYGRFWFEGKQQFAHRVSFRLFVGDLDDEELVLHQCDNPPCINPEHLTKGDHEENQRHRRTCHCGSCATCRHRDYMRNWSRIPANAERIRRRMRRKRAAA